MMTSWLPRISDQFTYREAARFVLALFALFLLPARGLSQPVSPDLPTRVANVQAIPEGSLIIPNALAASGSTTCGLSNYQPGGVKVYGAVVRLLHAGIAVRWAVRTDKLKDEVDFQADTELYDLLAGTTSGPATRAFCAGAWIVSPTRVEAARAVLNAFNAALPLASRVQAYRLATNTNIDILYLLTHKPVVGVLQNGGNGSIHTQFLVNAGLTACPVGSTPGSNCHYLTSLSPTTGLVNTSFPLLAENMTPETCVTILTEPHATISSTGPVIGIESFMTNGGNFAVQCHSVPDYELRAIQLHGTHGILTTHGMAAEQETNPPYDYPNADLAYVQFLGDLPSEGGSWGGGPIKLNPGAFYNNGYVAAQKGTTALDGSLPLEAFGGKFFGTTTETGGAIFYMGGHDWGTNTAGERLYLNTILVPATRPEVCGFDLTVPPQVDKVGVLAPGGDLDLSESITAGDVLEFTITVNNANELGLPPLTGIVLVDAIPANTTYVPNSTKVDGLTIPDAPTGTPFPLDNGGYSLSGGDLQPGETVVVTFRVKISDPMPVGVHEILNTATAQSNRGSGQGTATVPVEGVPDLTITKSSVISPTPQLAAPGDTLTYTIVVTNEGSITHTGVSVTDAVPLGTTYLAGSAYVTQAADPQSALDEFSTISYTGSDGTIPWSSPWNEDMTWAGGINDGGAINGGGIRVVADAVSGGNVLQIDNVNSGAWRQVDLATAGYQTAILRFRYRRLDANSALKSVAVLISADGGVTYSTLDTIIQDATDAAYTWRSYDITPYISANTRIGFLNNASNDKTTYFDDIEIEASTITTTLPAHAPSGILVPADNIELDPGESLTVRFKVIVDGVTLVQNTLSEITNRAWVQSYEDDACPNFELIASLDADLCSAAETDPVAPLALTKSAALVLDDGIIHKADPGDKIRYTVTVYNLTSSSQTNVRVIDEIPANTSYVAGTTTRNGSPLADQSVPPALTPFPLDETGHNLGTLAAWSSATFTFDVLVNDPLPGGTRFITNIANATSTQAVAKPARADVPAVSSDLQVNKTSDQPGFVGPGTRITYTIVVQNVGSSTLTSVSVDDPPPPGTTYVPSSTQVTGPTFVDTYADNFDDGVGGSTGYFGNDGTLSWTGSWIEVGDDGLPTSGTVLVVTDGTRVLEIDNANRGIYRIADTGGYAGGTVTFRYRFREAGAGKFLFIQWSDDNGSTWTNLGSLEATATTTGFLNASYSIPANLLVNGARLRFLQGSNNDRAIRLDDIQIVLTRSSAPGGAPPNLLAGHDINLDPGASMTITFQADVNAAPLPPGIVNTVTASATGTTPAQASVTDPVQDMTDTDGDGIPDYLDIDDDNDGILDIIEGRGIDPSADADGDGIPNYRDPDFPGFVDVNNDGVNDNFDLDLDGIPDHLDIDSDNDGIPDNIEAQRTVGYIPPSNDNPALATDIDGDGLDDAYDKDTSSADPYASKGLTPVDTDGDGIPDYRDLDSDNDGLPDTAENGMPVPAVDPGDPNNPDEDGDGLLDIYEGSNILDGWTAGTPDVNDQIDNPLTCPAVATCPLPDTDNDVAGGVPMSQDLDYRDANDYDGDGITDSIDIDDDNDGIPDIKEGASLFDPYGDADNDGIKNYLDTTPGTGLPPFIDRNNDGINDAYDPSADYDGDGIVNYADPNDPWLPPFIDVNGDGINDRYDADLDGIPNHLDLDSDNDGIPDVIEAGGPDEDGDGVHDGWQTPAALANPRSVDVDADGLIDVADNLVFGVTNGIPLPDPDTDGDGRPDRLDLDSDNDGIPDVREAGGLDEDGDGIHDAWNDPSTADLDRDGLADPVDPDGPNTPGTPLPDPDTDGDGRPDRLDLDSDNDGVPDVTEACTGTILSYGPPITYVNCALIDENGDGIHDAWNSPATADADGDGYADPVDALVGVNPEYPLAGSPGIALADPDSDGDGVKDRLDLDSDNDGIPDVTEACIASAGVNCAAIDTDGDGIHDAWKNPATADKDGDGYADPVDPLDGYEPGVPAGTAGWVNGTPLADSDQDQDGYPNRLDVDSDNDGITDVREAGGPDVNGDGIHDAWDGANPDPDGDGLVQAVDTWFGYDPATPAPGTTGTKLPLPNTDGDALYTTYGLYDVYDIDADDDGIPDNIEGQLTIGYKAPTGVDDDGDGLDNAYDPDCKAASPCTGGVIGAVPPLPDTDSDGTRDYLDLNSDNDGFTDIQENGWGLYIVTDFTDTDKDGLLDVFEGSNVNDPTDVNDQIDNPATCALVATCPLPDTDGDVLLGIPMLADLDYRDVDDFDGDGIADPKIDLDDDNDGIPDIVEGDPRALLDHDGDGVPNWLDQDYITAFGFHFVDPSGDDDNDGIPNWRDPDFEHPYWVSLGLPGFVDVNNDGVNDYFDKDLDGLPNHLDLDSDNDGIPDVIEAGGWDPDGDGRIGTGPITDVDRDGLHDPVDNLNGGQTPLVGFNEVTGGTPLPNPDTDGDGVHNFLDLDSDNDGIPDLREACVSSTTLNCDLLDQDGDGVLDVWKNPETADVDGDGWGDIVDKIGPPVPGTPLADPDTDGDGIKNRLDLDSDNDGVPDVKEAGGLDANGDGIIDDWNCDDAPNYTTCPNPDEDGDGLADSVDPDALVRGTPLPDKDTDGDGIKDRLDLDSDNDGVPDVREACHGTVTGTNPTTYLDCSLVDANGDGIHDAWQNPATADKDGDGYADPVDPLDGYDPLNPGTTFGWVNGIPLADGDPDRDGYPSRVDIDSDDDGITDVIEAGGPDANRDGIHDAWTGFNPDADKDGLVGAVDPVFGYGPTGPQTGGTPLPMPNTDQECVLESSLQCLPDLYDIDADNDGIPDNVEGQPTVGYVPPKFTAEGKEADTDGDGLNDAYDPDCVAPGDCYDNTIGVPVVIVNTDGTFPGGDTIPDYLDPDSDNDGFTDIQENNVSGDDPPPLVDTDGDGLLDVFDTSDDRFSPTGPDVNDNINVPATDLPDEDLDVFVGGDVDYRDLPSNPGIGAAKVVSMGPTQQDGGPVGELAEWFVEFTIRVRNTGNVHLKNVQVTEDLESVLITSASSAAAGWRLAPTNAVTVSPNLTANPAYNGGKPGPPAPNINLLTGTDELDPGEEGLIQIRLLIKVYGTSLFLNQVLASGSNATGTEQVQDLSDDSPVVDENKNGDPTDDNDPTILLIKEVSLAVELAEFGGAAQERDVEVLWRTASETNNAGFSLEHAFEGEEFEEMAFYAGHGSTTTSYEYRYVLREADFGLHQFRLKTLDLDGHFAYSDVVEVQVEIPGEFVLDDVYPNPFNPQATVRFAVRDARPIRLELYNVLGRFVQLLYDDTPEAGRSHRVTIEASALSSGVYFVRMVGEGLKASVSAIVLK